MNRLVLSVIGLLILLSILLSTLFVVDQRQYAIVFALGEVKQVINEPGLRFKLPPPFQNVLFLDKRILTLDTPEADRFITAEKKDILVDAYLKWHITDPRSYFVSFGGDDSQYHYGFLPPQVDRFSFQFCAYRTKALGIGLSVMMPNCSP